MITFWLSPAANKRPAIREQDLFIEAECSADVEGQALEFQRNMGRWLQYQAAKLFVRMGVKGHWRITAKIERVR